jgi:fatty acid desaturase
MVLAWLSVFTTLSIGSYLFAAYSGLSILKIRTFLEHRAFETVPGRIVVIEKSALFSWLFLNNNLHAVHHAYPGAAWYRLPEIYRIRRKQILQNNSNYCYASYWEVFRKYLINSKDPVAHPLFGKRNGHS